MDDPTPRGVETDPFKLAERERWLDLARLGKEAWNTWAEEELKKNEEDRVSVDLSSQNIDVWNFSGFIFPADADFRQATFSADASFFEATFSAEAYFSGATFAAGASFFGATFSAGAYFSEATFSADASFREATFSAGAYFREATFSAGAYFREATFSAGAYFSEATFSAEAYFREATFSAGAYFSEATFSAEAYFREATFSAGAYFSEATFSAGASFSEATFSAEAYFREATIKSIWQMNRAKVAGSLIAQSADIQGHAYFTGIDFQIPPDLMSTAFSQPPSFLGSTFRYPCDSRFWGKCSVNDGEARYRRLKQLAADAHDHELELRLFALETKAKRFHTLTKANPLHWPGLVLNFAYGWVSDFGQSVLRPLGWLLLTAGLAFATFWSTAPAATSLWISAVAAGVNVFPFAGQAVLGREIMTTGLCPMPETDVGYLDCLTTLYTISAVEGVFGLIFLFLIGLGLRNRFRIK